MSTPEQGWTLAQIAEAVGGAVEGNPSTRVVAASGLEDAGPGSLVRVEHPRYLEAATAGPAAALLVSAEIGPVAKPCIRVERVRLAFARCLELFAPPEEAPPGVHPTAVLGEDVELGEACSVGPYAVLGRGVRVGSRSVIHAHAVLHDEVEIGADSVIYAHAVLYPRTVVGQRVRVHAGAVIGADGYGYQWTGEGHAKIPQIGRVRLEDDVEVGANTTIDRATTGETVIGAGTKIDNLVQIGHNVRTGRHCLIISQTGIGGSTTLGDGVVLAGQTGVKDHVSIGDGVQAGGRAGIWGDQAAGQTLSGNPARPHREEVRLRAALSQLPELIRRVRRLERALEEETGAPPEGGTG